MLMGAASMLPHKVMRRCGGGDASAHTALAGRRHGSGIWVSMHAAWGRKPSPLALTRGTHATTRQVSHN